MCLLECLKSRWSLCSSSILLEEFGADLPIIMNQVQLSACWDCVHLMQGVGAGEGGVQLQQVHHFYWRSWVLFSWESVVLNLGTEAV